MNLYFELSGADETIWGFEYSDLIYAFYPTKDLMIERARITKSSTKKGGREKLSLNGLTRIQKQSLIVSGQAEIICTKDYLEQEAQIYGLNKGQAFEQILSLIHGQGYYKDNKAFGFWECGDIQIENKQVQVKFERCSLAELRTIERIKIRKETLNQSQIELEKRLSK